MTAIDLLAAALPPIPPPEPPRAGRCCVLGTIEPTIARGHAIRSSFTNHDLLRAPASDRVSVRAWRVITHRLPAEPGKKRDTFPLLQSSWLCDASQGPTLLRRPDVRRLVLEGVARSRAPWAGYVTTSYKKHGALRAPVNVGAAQRWLFELEAVDCSDRDQVAAWWSRLHAARTAGLPRPVLETLEISLDLLARHTALWVEFSTWARSCYHSGLYRFLCYLLPSEEELKGSADGQGQGR